MNILRSASLVVLASLAFAAQAQLTLTTGNGSAVTTPTNLATFDGLANGTDLTSYAEGGLSVTVPNIAYESFDPAVGNSGSGFSGSFFYSNGGTNRAVLIKRVDGTSISGLEFVAGNGFFNTTTNLAVFGVRGGSVYGSATLSVASGSVVGVSDPLGFDALYVGAYVDAGTAQSANINTFEALALDNLKVQAVPEPASMAALGLGAVAIVRRRKRA